jgi:hypothetical protein
MRVPDRYPEVIVNCRNEDDVMAAVRMAREEGLKLSVCSGGHSWHANHLRDGVLLVNMHGMTDYDLDVGSMTGPAQLPQGLRPLLGSHYQGAQGLVPTTARMSR